MKIPFYKPCVGQEEINEVVETLKGGWLTTGPRAKQFEQDFAAYVGQKQAVAVNSCTAALHLALEAVGLKAGQGVIVPTLTFAATAEVVRYLGAEPILVDCREEDFNLDVADAERRLQLERAAGREVVAAIPVHYGGQIGDIAGVGELARRYDLRLIEDAAHCCPAAFRFAAEAPWQSVGSGADISCYSFYANKCITTGEGGMACTQRDDYAERMRLMSLHGISKDAWKRFTAEGSWYYEIVAPGFKYNLTDLAAGIGVQQLRKADRLHQKRAERAAWYTRHLEDVEELGLPRQQPNRIHSWHLYVVRLRLEKLTLDRAGLVERLKQAGIGTSVHWMPLHLHPYYRETYGYRAEEFPVAARLYSEVLSLPLYPDLTEEEVAFVCATLKRLLAEHSRQAPAPRRRRQHRLQPAV